MKRGIVERDIDVSGVTGTGQVSTFCINDDGRIVIFWPVGVGVWPSLEEAVKVHGHDGKTRFVILDDPEAVEIEHCDTCHVLNNYHGAEAAKSCHDFGCPACLATAGATNGHENGKHT